MFVRTCVSVVLVVQLLSCMYVPTRIISLATPARCCVDRSCPRRFPDSSLAARLPMALPPRPPAQLRPRPPAPIQPQLTDPRVMPVAGGAELVAAFLNASIRLALISSPLIQLDASHWSNMTAPIVRTTDLTISGRPGLLDTEWPVLDFGLLRRKVGKM